MLKDDDIFDDVKKLTDQNGTFCVDGQDKLLDSCKMNRSNGTNIEVKNQFLQNSTNGFANTVMEKPENVIYVRAKETNVEYS